MFGRGFAFRGSSPGWPYVGIGRGGLPRCAAYFRGYEPIGFRDYNIENTKEQELEYLKRYAEDLQRELKRINERIAELKKTT
ncbi:MAG: DUF5320 family protein [Deferribacterota bacterium]|nr:DUF5320 family protein [Deferribacterota bacterium]